MMTTSKTKRERCWNRSKPCTCGCQGRDPWHQQSYRRVVRDVTRIDDVTEEGWIKLLGRVRVTRTKVTQFVYDETHPNCGYFEPVLRSDGTQPWGGWHIDRDSYLDAQNALIDGDA